MSTRLLINMFEEQTPVAIFVVYHFITIKMSLLPTFHRKTRTRSLYNLAMFTFLSKYSMCLLWQISEKSQKQDIVLLPFHSTFPSHFTPLGQQGSGRERPDGDVREDQKPSQQTGPRPAVIEDARPSLVHCRENNSLRCTPGSLPYHRTRTLTNTRT